MKHRVLALVFGLLLPLIATAERAAALPPAALARFDHAVELLNDYRGDTSMLEAARADLDAVLQGAPRHAPSHREMARYFIMRGHVSGYRFRPGSLEAAEVAIARALAIKPDYAEAFVLRGHLYRLMDRHQEAVAALVKAERLGTDDPWLHNNWADLLIDEDRYDEAAQRYRRVIDSRTTNRKAMSAALGGLIDYYEGTDRLDQADEMYRRLIDYEPRSAWNHGNHAQFLLCRRDDAEASVAESRQALQLMDYGVGRFWLAAGLYRQWAKQVLADQAGKGQPYFVEAQALQPDPAEVAARADSCPPLASIAEALARGQGTVQATLARPVRPTPVALRR